MDGDDGTVLTQGGVMPVHVLVVVVCNDCVTPW